MLSRQLVKPFASSLRSYTTVVTPAATSTAKPRKVGAFRGGFMGFLLGVAVTGFGSYYYLLDQYKFTNSVVVADVVALQTSIDNLERHIKTLESKK